jgi:hypothetical protein
MTINTVLTALSILAAVFTAMLVMALVETLDTYRRQR